jgi:tyrosyl-tRNA synthetase
MDQARLLSSFARAEIREAKHVLVCETTERCHGEEAASEARREIQEGGACVDDACVGSIDRRLTATNFTDGHCLVRVGKKRYHRLELARSAR